MPNEYPEHKKLKAVQHLTQNQVDFLMWLEDHGLLLCEDDGHSQNYVRTNRRMVDLVAEYHEIDLKKIDAEKDQMLEEFRNANKVNKS